MLAKEGHVGTYSRRAVICELSADTAVGVAGPVGELKLFLCDVKKLRQIISVPVGVGGGDGACGAAVYQQFAPVSVALLSAKGDERALNGDELLRVEGETESVEHLHRLLLSGSLSSVQYPFLFIG